jgi:hypothetical protein
MKAGKIPMFSIGNDFLNRIPIAQEILATIDQWDYIK